MSDGLCPEYYVSRGFRRANPLLRLGHMEIRKKTVIGTAWFIYMGKLYDIFDFMGVCECTERNF